MPRTNTTSAIEINCGLIPRVPPSRCVSRTGILTPFTLTKAFTSTASSGRESVPQRSASLLWVTVTDRIGGKHWHLTDGTEAARLGS
jgi:hypothetical protein